MLRTKYSRNCEEASGEVAASSLLPNPTPSLFPFAFFEILFSVQVSVVDFAGLIGSFHPCLS